MGWKGRWNGLALAAVLAAAGLMMVIFTNKGKSLGFLLFALGGVFLLAAWLVALAVLSRQAVGLAGRLAHWASVATYALLAAGALSFFLIEGLILQHAGGTREPDAATLIVLGAGLREDQPSAVLAARLQTALEYLLAHPESQVVVTGGQGADELYTEGWVMANWLADRGIARERIFLEEQATDTRENLRFSWEIIQQKNLPGPVAVVSNTFHLFRAQTLARQEGLGEVETLAAPIPCAYQIPGFYLREYCSVVLMFLQTIF